MGAQKTDLAQETTEGALEGDLKGSGASQAALRKVCTSCSNLSSRPRRVWIKSFFFYVTRDTIVDKAMNRIY